MYRIEPPLQSCEIVQYLRKSRADDPCIPAEEVLARHEAILQNWAISNLPGPIPKEHIFREIVSGETIRDRPEFLRLLRLIESPHIRAILVVEVQRLSRGDLEDAGRLIKILRFTHTLVITPHKIYNLEDEYDRDFFERELKRGNEFLEYTKKILNRGRYLSVSQGNYIAPIAPYGMRKCWEQDGRKKYPTLEENEKADIVRLIFHKFVCERYSPYAIGLYLDNIGEKPPKGEHWTVSTILEILKNVHYDQKVCWGRRPVEHRITDGKILDVRPRKKEYLIFDGKHPRVVEHDLFQKAQELLTRTTRTRHDCLPVNPFAGLLFCSSCGYSITFQSFLNKTSVPRPPRMHCSNQRHCHSGSCSYHELEAAIINTLKYTISDFQISLSPDTISVNRDRKNTLKNLELRLCDLKQKELRQWEKYADGEMPKEIFEQLNDQLRQSRKNIRKILEQTKTELSEFSVPFKEKTVCLSDALAALQDDTVSASLKNEYLKTIIEKISYRRPASVRGHKDSSLPASRGGWISMPIELDIRLKL